MITRPMYLKITWCHFEAVSYHIVKVREIRMQYTLNKYLLTSEDDPTME